MDIVSLWSQLFLDCRALDCALMLLNSLNNKKLEVLLKSTNDLVKDFAKNLPIIYSSSKCIKIGK